MVQNGGLNIDLETKMAAFVNKIQLLYDAIMAFLTSVQLKLGCCFDNYLKQSQRQSFQRAGTGLVLAAFTSTHQLTN